MIQTCTAFNPLPDPATTPFCDKNFQALRLAAATIGRICLIIIYTVASYCSWIFSEDCSHYFQSLVNYYGQLNFAQSEAFVRFGKSVIDFSVNITRRSPDAGYENETETLKELYGDELIAQWSTIESPEISLNPTKLKCLKITRPIDGCCFGISMDFIFRYLKEISKGISPLEAIKRVAPLFAEGATEEAEISHIFYRALDLKNALSDDRAQCELQLKVRLKARLAILLQRIVEEAKIEVALEEERKLAEINVLGGDPTEIESQRATLKAGLAKREVEKSLQIFEPRKEALISQSTAEVLAENARSAFAREKIIAQQIGLSSQCSQFTFIRESEQAWGDFHNFLANLQTGTYQIGLKDSGQGPVGHSLVFIKTDNLCFILDPNSATIAFPQEEASQGLWEIATSHYLLKGRCTLTFNSLELL